MTEGAVQLAPWEVFLALLLVAGSGAVSLALRLDLHRRLAWATVRMVVQLSLLGLVLQFLFDLRSTLALGLWASAMIVMAGRAAVQRVSRILPGSTLDAVLSLALASGVTTLYGTAMVVGRDPTIDAQYVIPLLGMVLGNSLNGISLCLDTLLDAFADKRHQIEADLAHGATPWEASLPHLVAAIRRGMIPIINAMMIAGLVSLPGMMTGQILQGADPMQAVAYQIVIIAMIAAAVTMGSIFACLLAYRRLFTPEMRLGPAPQQRG